MTREPGETDRSSGAQYLWCRVEEEGGRVRRVQLMHPNGEIWLSYPPEVFEPTPLSRMRAGQIHAFVSAARPDGTRSVSVEDDAGRVVFAETVAADAVPSSDLDRSVSDSER